MASTKISQLPVLATMSNSTVLPVVDGGVTKTVTGSVLRTYTGTASGPQGPQGVTGPQGPQGVTGPQGPQGVTGPQGSTGNTGPQGPQGVAGAQGPQGPAGSNGSNGSNGGTGNTGPTGPSGPSGSAASSGFIKILATTYSGTSYLNSSVFDFNSYNNYRVIISFEGDSNQNLYPALQFYYGGGVDGNYVYGYGYLTPRYAGTDGWVGNGNNAVLLYGSNVGAGKGAFSWDIFKVGSTVNGHTFYAGYPGESINHFYYPYIPTGFQFASGNMYNGTVAVYAYSK
jgi:hypothetical protein